MLPPAPPPGPFRYQLRARYPECDAQGIVFNARYGDWTDLATTELLRAISPGWLAAGEGAFEYRLRVQQTDWLAPARFDDGVCVAPTVTEVGRSSFQVESRFTRARDRAALAVVKTTYVRVDGASGRPQPLTPFERDGLQGGAPGVVTDHSGLGGGQITGRVRAVDAARMLWKNGQGVTHELHREGEGAQGFALRVSMAEVSADGPFSRFPGVDRVLCLLRGDGMALERADGLSLRLTEAGLPFCFPGEDGWSCRLLGGPNLDLNVMADRASTRVAVSRVGPGLVPGGLVFVLQDCVVAGEAVEAHTLLRLDGPARTTATVLAVAVMTAV